MASIRAAAQTPTPMALNQPPITHHTAVVTHIWLSLIHARSLRPHPSIENLAPETTLTLSLSIRPRVEPPLPKTFLGSPLAQASTTISIPPITESSSSDPKKTLQATSLALATSMAAFSDPTIVSDFLHDAHFFDSPQRYWDCFLGERHIIATSWCRTGFYEVDFWGKRGGGLRYAQPLMESIDGIVVIYEAGPLLSVEDKGTSHWTDPGLDILISARTGVLEALKEGQMLRSFRT